MGSSVFHGGFSTFLAIILTAPSRSYVFIVFFRLWFSIILFGMANGCILLPVILSLVGPTYTPKQIKDRKLSKVGSETERPMHEELPTQTLDN